MKTYTFKAKGTIRLPMSIDHQAVHHKIKSLKTIEEKRELVGETNPLLYAFGERLLPSQHLSYADYLDKLYIGSK